MAKFRDIALGPLARRAIEFPLPSGRIVKVDVVPLFGESEAAVLKEARAFAQERGIPDPKDGDELYELGRWIAVIVRGVVDPDSPEDAPQPFFDGGAAQILDERTGLGREWIALLFEAQQAWQDELAPRPKGMNAGEYLTAILNIIQAPPRSELPFFRWRRVLQDSFLRMLCATWRDAHPSKSLFGAPLPDGSTDSENSAPLPTSNPSPKAEE